MLIQGLRQVEDEPGIYACHKAKKYSKSDRKFKWSKKIV
jgi:hypothetical protein